MLKNSENVYAMVLYTGPDTKLVLNQGKYKFKNSQLAKTINKFMGINLFVMIMLVILMSQIMNRTWHSSHASHKYLFPEETMDVNRWSTNTIFSFYLLLNGFIPLDLAVTITLSKMFYVWAIQSDYQMVSEEKSFQKGEVQGCVVRNLELIQDFALVNNLFCDKTGTLTKNVLIFNCLAVDGTTISIQDGTPEFKR